MINYGQPGTITTIHGSPGSGKTNLALFMGELLHKANGDLEIITNIRLKRDYPRYNHTIKLSYFLWYLATLKGEGLVIFDEGGQFATSTHSKTSSQITEFIKLCRKYETSIIWIDQVFYGSTPKQIRKMASYSIDTYREGAEYRYNWHNVRPYKNDAERDINFSALNRGLTSIPYDHLSVTTFKIDLPKRTTISDLFFHVSTGGSKDNQQKTIDWLNKNNLEPPKTTRFEGLYTGESNNGEGETSGTDTEGEKSTSKPPDPATEIKTRGVVWGILQRNPRTPSRRIADLLKVDYDTVNRYRQEFKGKRRIPDNATLV